MLHKAYRDFTAKDLEGITDIQARRKAYLMSTAKFYNNSNRSINCTDTACLYKPENDQSPGCAIGRFCPSINLIEGKGVKQHAIFDKLPDWMKDVGMEFLSDIQKLHDRRVNWDDLELSVVGKKTVSSLLKKYNL